MTAEERLELIRQWADDASDGLLPIYDQFDEGFRAAADFVLMEFFSND